MKIIKNATAGTVESSDIMITVQPIESTENTIELESSVEKQFGNQIRQVITTTLEHLDVQGVAVKAIDKGALDCTIKARMITVLHRGAEKKRMIGRSWTHGTFKKNNDVCPWSERSNAKRCTIVWGRFNHV